MGIYPQQAPILTSQIAHDVLDQMIYQNFRRNAMQAYVKYKTFHGKKANASALKEAEYVYLLQPKADHKGSKILFTVFWWIGPSIMKKCYLITIIWYAKPAPTRRMWFTSREPIPGIRITPQKRTPGPEVNLNHDDLFAKAWECEYEKPNFDAENDNATPPKSFYPHVGRIYVNIPLFFLF